MGGLPCIKRAVSQRTVSAKFSRLIRTIAILDRTSADGITESNNTNLAIKGIIGIAAMAEISQAMGNTAAAQQYQVITTVNFCDNLQISNPFIAQANATTYVKLWESLASSSGHLLPTYEDASSSDFALMYNMYADTLLKTNLIDQSVCIPLSSAAVNQKLT